MSKLTKMLLILIFALMLVIPVIMYNSVIGKVQYISTEELASYISNGDNSNKFLILDIRDSPLYEEENISGSINWEYESIIATDSLEDAPINLAGKKVYVLCEAGISSAIVASQLKDKFSIDTYNITGGFQKWRTNFDSFCVFTPDHDNPEQYDDKYFKSTSLFGQVFISVSAFGLKPIYMIISFIIFIWLFRQKDLSLIALKWAAFSFLLGEGFCAINFLFFNSESILFEYLHIAGMVLSFGFTTFSVFQTIDEKVIRITEKSQRCALIDSCKKCYKYNNVSCKAISLIKAFIFVLIIVSIFILLMEPNNISYNSDILGTKYSFIHPVIFQIFEIKYSPIAAAVLYFAAFTLLLMKTDNIIYVKILVSSASGFLGFTLFRVILFSMFTDNLVWFEVGEEITEFIFMIFTLYILWIYRKNLKNVVIKKSTDK